MALRPVDTDESRKGFRIFSTIFRQKGRWGVIARNRHEDIRDLYVATVEAGTSPLPGFVTMLAASNLETVRPDNVLLLTMVVKFQAAGCGINTSGSGAKHGAGTRSQRVPVVQEHTGQPAAAAFLSGSNWGCDLQSSSCSSGRSSQAPFGTPQTPTAPPPNMSHLAVQILGPYVHAPVVSQLLASVGDMTQVQLQNLRDILSGSLEQGRHTQTQ